jgi:hypothetical protein
MDEPITAGKTSKSDGLNSGDRWSSARSPVIAIRTADSVAKANGVEYLFKSSFLTDSKPPAYLPDAGATVHAVFMSPNLRSMRTQLIHILIRLSQRTDVPRARRRGLRPETLTLPAAAHRSAPSSRTTAKLRLVRISLATPPTASGARSAGSCVRTSRPGPCAWAKYEAPCVASLQQPPASAPTLKCKPEAHVSSWGGCKPDPPSAPPMQSEGALWTSGQRLNRARFRRSRRPKVKLLVGNISVLAC